MTSPRGRPRDSPRVLFAFVLLSALAGSRGTSASGLPGKWVEARSAHFVVLGNVSEKKAREVARDFELFREFFALRISGTVPAAGPPLRIFVARDEETMKVLMPALLEKLGSRTVGGRFVDGATAQFIELRTSGDTQTVYHEYFHYFARRFTQDLPLWLEEGLADFWGATRFTAASVEIGRLLPERMKLLAGPSLPSLERLLVLDRDSLEYRDPMRIGGFYAESWALVHYLVLAEKGARSEQLSRYIQLVAAGRKSLAAAKEAFGDLDRLAEGLRRYGSASKFPLGRMPPADADLPREIAVRAVGDAEIAARIAIAQFHTEAAATLLPWTELAAREAPGSGLTELAAGLLAIRQQRFGDAEAALTRATRAGESEAIAWYGLAVIELQRDSSPAGLALAEADLLRALESDPGFAPAHSRLAGIYLRLGTDPKRALAAIRLARHLRPDDDVLTAREIQILDRLGSRTDAETRTAKLIAEALKSQAPAYLNDLCRNGCLLGHAQAYRPLCEKAVELAPKNAAYLDSRGLARGATGDTAGAAADLRAALATPNFTWSAEQRSLRQSWIDNLDEGRSPFSSELFERLLDDLAESLGWGR